MIVQSLFSVVGFQFDSASFRKVQQALGSLGTAFAAIGATVAAVGAGIAYEVGQIADAGFQASLTAQKIGVTTQALQELEYASKFSGLQADTLERAMGRLAMKVEEAAQGSESASLTLSALGVSAYDASGKLKAPDMLLEGIADKFASMPDGIKKTGLAMQTFGRGGKELIPFLNQGSAGVEKLRKRANELGVVMSDDLIARSKAYKQASIELSAALDGLKIAMFGPLVQGVKWRKLLTEFIIKHREAVASGFLKFWDTLRATLVIVGRAFGAVYLGLKAFAEAPWWKQLLMAIGVLGLAITALGAGFIATAWSAITAWVAAALPFVAIGLAIAGLMLVLEDLYVFIKGGHSVIGDYLVPSFKKFFTEQVPAWVSQATDILEGFFDKIGDYINKKFPQLNMLVNFAAKVTGYSSELQFGPVGGVGDVSSAAVGGGGVSPAASAAAGGSSSDFNMATSFSPNITINAPGGDADAIASAVSRAVNEHWDTQMRQTNAAVGGAR